jgi:putative SOS response-associated peptidase YedK
MEGGKTRQNAVLHYSPPQEDQWFAFAGLYNTWTNPEGDDISTFTIITKDADNFRAKLHNHMPLFLARDGEEAWLDTHLMDTNRVLDLIQRCAQVDLDAYPVSRMVNKPSVDREALIRPVE